LWKSSCGVGRIKMEAAAAPEGGGGGDAIRREGGGRLQIAPEVDASQVLVPDSTKPEDDEELYVVAGLMDW
jgi:hypothetical protein